MMENGSGRSFKKFPIGTCVVLTIFFGGTMVNAQSQDDKLTKLQKKLELITKEAEIAKKEKEKAEFEKARIVAENSIKQATLTLEKEKAEKQQAKAEAEAAALRAVIPKSEVKALEGKTTLDDNVKIESNILSHVAVGHIGKKIAKDLSSTIPADSTVIVFDEQISSKVLNYHGASAEIAYLLQKYEELKVSPPTDALFVPPLLGTELAAGVLRSVIDVVSLFRTDTEIKGKEFTIEESALVAEIVRNGSSNFKVIYPSIYPPGLILDASEKTILSDLNKLNQLQAEAENNIKEYEALPDSEKEQHPLYTKIDALKALIEQHNKLTSVLMTRDEETGFTGLAQLIGASALFSTLTEGNGYVLYVDILAAGGYNLTERSLFLGTTLYHSGGSIVTYLLFDAAGKVISSNTLSSYTGRKEHDAIKGNLNLEAS